MEPDIAREQYVVEREAIQPETRLFIAGVWASEVLSNSITFLYIIANFFGINVYYKIIINFISTAQS